jgi:hypothetical protein
MILMSLASWKDAPPKIIHLIYGNKTTLYILDLLLKRRDDILSFGELDAESWLLKISYW